MFTSIDNFSSVFDAVAYTLNKMKDSGYSDDECTDFISLLSVEDQCSALDMCENQLEECAKLSYRVGDIDSTWHDSYYTSLMDDYDIDDVEDCDLYNSILRRNGLDKEAYEGFSSCKDTYWDDKDDESTYWDVDHVCDSIHEEKLYNPWD